jgi:hypothetical protein
MATVQRPIRLVNPGHKRKRKSNAGKGTKRLTWKQKLHFGTKRQRSAAMARLGNPKRTVSRSVKGIYGGGNRRIKRAIKSGQYKKATYLAKDWNRRRRKHEPERLPNVGEILTIRPLMNSGHRKSGKRKRRTLNNSMARKRRHNVSAKRRAAGLKAARTRRRRGNTGVAHHRRRSYRRRRTTVNAAPRRRHYRRNTGRRRSYRRNPGGSMFQGGFGQAMGVIAGAILSKFVSGAVASFSPTLASGFPLYIVMAITAVAQGKVVGKLLKNPKLGADMTIGGWVALAIQLMNDFLPGLSPFSLSGLRGMGFIAPSNFYTPQVNRNGSMGSFLVPNSITGAIAAAGMVPAAAVAGGMKGLGSGMNQRRVGRLR